MRANLRIRTKVEIQASVVDDQIAHPKQRRNATRPSGQAKHEDNQQALFNQKLQTNR